MDKLRLEYEMRKKGISVDDLCRYMGISRSSYYRKVLGKTEFTLAEIKKIIEFVKIEDPKEIFFAEKAS